jgi:hypothetical protein
MFDHFVLSHEMIKPLNMETTYRRETGRTSKSPVMTVDWLEVRTGTSRVDWISLHVTGRKDWLKPILTDISFK